MNDQQMNLEGIEISEDNLRADRHAVSRSISFAEDRRKRLQNLVSRKSSAKWKAEKATKMIRRLVATDRIIDAGNQALIMIDAKLLEMKSEKKLRNNLRRKLTWAWETGPTVLSRE